MLYCDACEIQLEHKEHDNDGTWFPSKRKIVLDREMDESTEIATFLHELGHSTDDYLTNPKTEKKYDNAYRAFYKNEATEKQNKLVLECEKRAWFYGRGIAKKLRIPLGKWYDKEEEASLKDYGEDSREVGS